MDKKLTVKIEGEKLLDSISSGSGITLWNDSLFIITDDAPYIYRISLDDYGYSRTLLRGYDSADYRIPKPVKPDFETAAAGKLNGEEYIFAFGSGSKSPTRDSLLILKASNVTDQRIVPLTSLYRHLQTETKTPADQWNIEGLAITNDTLLLFNRGSNMVIEINWKVFTRFLTEGTLPTPGAHYLLQLPEHEGHLARISGACTLNDAGDILFCASIEDTPNWYTDGPVVGSYIGIFNRKSRQVQFEQILKDNQGRVLKEKVESVEVLEQNADGSIKAIAITDNDKGNSRLLEIVIR